MTAAGGQAMRPSGARFATPGEQCTAYERAQAACEEAFAARPALVHESFFVFAGRQVCVRVAGRQLSDHLTLPFAHLRTQRDRAIPISLQIDAWDERETHVAYPSGGDAGPAEKSWPSGHGTLAVSRETQYVRYDCNSWVTWLDRAAPRIVAWRANADRLSMHERTRPFPFLLPVWYADVGVSVIHAALVARDGRGVLLCGSKGAGKSTSSLACLCGGLEFLSDDHVGLEEIADGSFIGHSVFSSIRLEADHLENFPQLLPHAIRSHEPTEPKSLVMVDEAMPLSVRRSVPIRALAMPTITGAARSRVQPASRAEVLRALAPSTLMQMPFGANRDRFAKLARLAASVPVFRLEIGRDLGHIATGVNALLDLIP